MSHDAGQIAAEMPAKSRRKSTGRPADRMPPAKPPADGYVDELGVSGTENMMGIISGAEYLPALVPPNGLKVYDQMRRSSAQVKASLWIVKTPILSSTPVVQAFDKSDPVNVGIADFCQAALFGPGAMTIKWREVFEHLMTRLEFGVSVSEKVWRFDRPSRTWRIHKLAPRLATTLSGWKMAPGTSDLAFVEQQAFRPGGSFDPILMPASKCLVSTYQREGDNWWGTSILRGAYMHWFYLMELYRIDMVRADRYGAGIPKAKFTTADAWNNTKVVNQVKRALRALRSHERAYVLEHPEVDFSVMGPGGSDGGARLKESIEHHAQMIVQNVLASFLSAQSDGMSTNRTFTLSDIFSSVVEMVAAEAAEDLTDQVIRELCDLNFVMEGRPYPKVVFTNIAHDDLEALTTQLTRLSAVGAYSPIPEDEAHFRTMYKLPERKEPAEPSEPTADEPDPDDDEDDDGEDDPKADPPDTKRARVLAARRKDEPLLGRAPTPLERVLLRDPSRRALRLNQISANLEGRLTAVRRLQLDQLVKAIVAKDARTTTTAFTDLRPDEFRIPEARLTEKAITDVQREAFAYGRATVRQELVRQGARLSVRARAVDADCRILAATSKKAQPATPDSAASARSALLTSAKVTAELLNDLWFGRVLETAVRIRRGGARGKELAKGVWDALETELSGGLWGKAKAEVNEALALGRGVEARINADEIDLVVHSAILDTNLCEKCEEVDGEEMEYGSARMYELMPPYAKCDGNKGGVDACRCEHLYLLKDRTV